MADGTEIGQAFIALRPSLTGFVETALSQLSSTIAPITASLEEALAANTAQSARLGETLTASLGEATTAVSALAASLDGTFTTATAESVTLGETLDTAMATAGTAVAAVGTEIDAALVGVGPKVAASAAEANAAISATSAESTALGGVLGGAFTKGSSAAKQFAADTGAVAPTILGLTNIEAGLGIAIAAVAGVTTDMASKFQATMEQLNTQAGVAQGQIAGLSNQVLDLAGKVGVGPSSLADALYHVESTFASTGIKGSEAMKILQIAAEGARVGNANLVDITNALDAAIVSGIPGVQNYQQAMGVLNATVGAGDMKMQDLANAFGTGILTIAKQYGATLTDVSAALAVFGDNQIRGQVAATDLRMAIMDLTKQSPKGEEALAKLGIKAGELGQDLQSGGLNAALTDLENHLNKAGITGSKVGSVLEDAFTKKSSAPLAVLLGEFDRLQSKYVDLNEGANRFGDAWTQTQDTVKQKLADLQASFDSLAIELGTILAPVVELIIAGLTGLIQKLVPLFQAFGEFGTVITRVSQYLTKHKQILGDIEVALVALLIKGLIPLLPVLARFIASIVGASAPFLLVGTAIAVVTGAIQKAYQQSATFRDVVNQVGTDISNVWSNIQKSISTVINDIIGAFTKYHDVVIAAAGAISVFVAGMYALQVGKTIVDSLRESFAALSILLSPEALIVVGIGALAAGITYAYQQFSGFKDIVDQVATSIGNFASNSVKELQTIIAKGGVLRTTFNNAATAIKELFTTISDAVVSAAPSVFSAAQNIGSFIARVVEDMGTLGKKAALVLANAAQTGANAVISMAHGLPDFAKQAKTVLGDVGNDIKKLATGDFSLALNIADQLGLGPKGEGEVSAALTHILQLRSAFFTALHGDFGNAGVQISQAIGVDPASQRKVFDGINQIESSVKSFFNGVGNLAKGNVVGAGKDLISVLGLNSSQAAAVQKATKEIQGPIDDFKYHISNSFKELTKGNIAGTTGNIAEALGFGDKTATEVQKRTTDFTSHTKNALQSLLKGSGTGVVGNAAEAMGFGDKTATDVQKTFTKVEGNVKTGISSVLSFVANKLSGIGKFFLTQAPEIEDIFKTIVSIVSSAIDAVVLVIKTGASVLGFIWDSVGKYIIEAVSTAWDLIKSVISAAILVIEGIIEIVLGALSGHWSDVWKGIKDVVAGIWDGIYAVIKAAIQLVWEIIQAVLSLVWNFIKDGFQTLWNFIKDVWNGITSAIGDAINWIWNTIQKIFSDIWNFIKKIWNDAVDIVKQGWNNLITGVSVGVNGVIKLVQDLPTQIKNIFNDAVHWLENIGGDIIHGLWQGIKDAWHTITDLISSLASSLPDPIKKILGINSPSLVFAELGKSIPEGFAKGIKDHASLAHKAVSDLGSSLGTQMNTSLRVAKGLSPDITSSSGIMVKQYNLSVNSNYESSADPITWFKRLERTAR